MKVGPKEQQTRLLGPPGIARQYGSEPKAGYTIRQPVTKLRQFVTANNSVTLKRGAKPKGETAMSQAERAKAYRARKAAQTTS